MEKNVPGDVDLSDRTAASTAAASTCPSFSSRSLLQTAGLPMPP